MAEGLGFSNFRDVGSGWESVMNSTVLGMLEVLGRGFTAVGVWAAANSKKASGEGYRLLG